MKGGQSPLIGLLDTLCPMHVLVDATGHIAHAGPTLFKLRAGRALIGIRFLELFELKRPRHDGTMASLRGLAGTKLHLQLREVPRTDVKGALALMPEDGSMGLPGGVIIDLSFGISVLDAIRDFDLTSADFAATDLTIEMLYLIEAKTAAMEASHMLNLRLQGAKIAAEEKAYTDTLTGLGNRRALDNVLQRLVASEQDFALIHLDLDYFKAVNDTLGHAAGDHVLRQAAALMLKEIRGDDVLVRAGGDEFVLILTRLTDARRVHDIASRLIARLEEPIPFNGKTCRVSGSAGSALSCNYPQPGLDLARMMEDADIALYAAKVAGRGRHMTYGPEMRRAAQPPVARDDGSVAAAV